jgi:hypothetical protein
MRIVQEYIDIQTEELSIVTAIFIGDFAIRIFFNDGIFKLVDFKAFLEKSSHPSIKKYLDEDKFKQFKVIEGNLNWNDYELIFPVADLYNGKI